MAQTRALGMSFPSHSLWQIWCFHGPANGMHKRVQTSVPSGHQYGTSLFFIGKFTMNGLFEYIRNMVKLPEVQRVYPCNFLWLARLVPSITIIHRVFHYRHQFVNFFDPGLGSETALWFSSCWRGRGSSSMRNVEEMKVYCIRCQLFYPQTGRGNLGLGLREGFLQHVVMAQVTRKVVPQCC